MARTVKTSRVGSNPGRTLYRVTTAHKASVVLCGEHVQRAIQRDGGDKVQITSIVGFRKSTQKHHGCEGCEGWDY